MKRWFGFAILAFVAGCEGKVSDVSVRTARIICLPAWPGFHLWGEMGVLIGQRRTVCERAMNALGALAAAERGALSAPASNTATSSPAPAVDFKR